MHITRTQFKRIRHLLPLPRGSVRISHYRFLNALAYMASNGCKWRSLPARFGPWHTVAVVVAESTRMSRSSRHLSVPRAQATTKPSAAPMPAASMAVNTPP